ncbi:MAG: hypothetical protein V2B18_02095 [Pseudomonadota bacterium]
MTERESIIAALQGNLWNVPGIRLVERNLHRTASVDDYPAVFVIDEGDDVTSSTSRYEYRRAWRISLAVFIGGSSDNAAVKELSEFVRLVKSAMYATGKVVAGVHRGIVNEIRIGPVEFPAQGDHVVGQKIMFEIVYVETIPGR